MSAIAPVTATIAASREGEGARKAQAKLSGGLKSLEKGAHAVRGGAMVFQGVIGIGFKLLWILAGLASLMSGSVVILIGAGSMPGTVLRGSSM